MFGDGEEVKEINLGECYEEGSPEMRFWKTLPEKGLIQIQIQVRGQNLISRLIKKDGELVTVLAEGLSSLDGEFLSWRLPKVSRVEGKPLFLLTLESLRKSFSNADHFEGREVADAEANTILFSAR